MGDTKMEKSDTEMEKSTDMPEKVEKTEKRGSGSVDLVTLRDDLFHEATNLISEAPSSKIAILVNHPGSSSGSDVSMFSFGCPSVNDVVETFLKDSKCPDAVPVDADDEDDAEEEDQSSEMFWWDDPKVSESTNPEVLKAAVDSIEEMLDMLKAELNAERSGNYKDLHNDNAETKP